MGWNKQIEAKMFSLFIQLLFLICVKKKLILKSKKNNIHLWDYDPYFLYSIGSGAAFFLRN